MDVAQIFSLIREFGFPTVFCLWLMYMQMRRERNVERTMKEVVTALNKVNANVDQVAGEVMEEVRHELSGGIRVGMSSPPAGQSSPPIGSSDVGDTLRLPAPPKKAGS